jgi:hypothetical protein
MNNFTKVNVAGDGACYFHSVTGYLELDKNVKKLKDDKKYTYFKKGNASQLRKKVVAWLRKNLDYKLPNGITIRDDIEDAVTQNSDLSSINDYLNHMSKEGAYAGQIEITATSIILKRNIRTFIQKGNKLSNVGLGYEITKSKDDDIHLFHNLGSTKAKGLHHFEILYPKKKAKVVTKKEYDKLQPKSKPKRTVRRRPTRKKPTRKKPTRKKPTKRRKSGKRP